MGSEIVFKSSDNYKGKNQPSTSVKNIDLSIYSLNSQQIGAQTGAVDATATIYTVPAGYTLFITSVNLQSLKYTAIANAANYAKLLFNSQVISRIKCPLVEGDSVVLGYSFAAPYILRSGEKVEVTSESANVLAQAGITAYLVRNSDLFY